MYVGVLLVIVSEAVLRRSWQTFAYSGIVAAMFALAVVAVEEPLLRCQFGDTYARYCAQVPRWLPRWPRLQRRGPDSVILTRGM
jgi:protein-S-isoprenylcysteine O-methyltransferase Ste14